MKYEMYYIPLYEDKEYKKEQLLVSKGYTYPNGKTTRKFCENSNNTHLIILPAKKWILLSDGVHLTKAILEKTHYIDVCISGSIVNLEVFLNSTLHKRLFGNFTLESQKTFKEKLKSVKFW